MDRKTYPLDVSDEEWAFAAPYLILLPLWGATIILSGRTTIMMAGGEESKAA
jgi:hypothetical protein